VTWFMVFVRVRELVVACRCESGPGSCQEARDRRRPDDGMAVRQRGRRAARRLRQAVRDAKRAGHAYVILDGTLIPVDRVARGRPFYSGKHKKHGMNLQVIASPDGSVPWVSGALPGSVRDKKTVSNLA
jgi:hypothetical protein